jgi:hypothetical protein
MTQVNFTIESKLNGNNGKLVASTNPQNESPVLKGGKENFSLKPGDKLCIKVKENGKAIDLRNGLYIRISPLDGLNCELSTTETEIKITLPKDLKIVRNYSVTVGAGTTG